MQVPGTAIKGAMQRLTLAADTIAESRRPGAAALTGLLRGGVARDMTHASSVLKDLGVIHARAGEAILTDAKALLNGATHDRMVSHMEDGISLLRGRLAYTPVG